MIFRSRVFSLALLLAIAAFTPGVLKAQDAQPMNEVSLGSGAAKTSGGTADATTSLDGGTITDVGGTTAPAAATGPEAVAFDGTYVWVATQFNDSVTRIRVSDGSIAGSFTVGKRPVALLYAGGYVWVANLFSDNVMKLTPSTGAIAGTYQPGDGPGGIGTFKIVDGAAGVLFDGTNLWVVNTGR